MSAMISNPNLKSQISHLPKYTRNTVCCNTVLFNVKDGNTWTKIVFFYLIVIGSYMVAFTVAW
jgi:hypothetical protein